MKKFYLYVLVIILATMPIVSYGYDGRFYSIDMPAEYKEHNANVSLDESSIVFRKSNASAEFGLKGDIKISAIKTNSGKKIVKVVLKGYSNKALVDALNEASDGKDGEIIGAEAIKINGENGVKSVKKENGKYITSYQVATNSKLITILIASNNVSESEELEYSQIVNSLKIKRSLIDYWQKIVIAVVALFIISAIYGKIKGNDNNDILARR